MSQGHDKSCKHYARENDRERKKMGKIERKRGRKIKREREIKGERKKERERG